MTNFDVLQVVVAGPHASSSFSMHRASTQIADAYRDAGVEVSVWRPPALSAGLKRGRLARLLRMVELHICAPLALRGHLGLISNGPRVLAVHVADQGDAAWLIAQKPSVLKIVTVHDLLAVEAAEGRFEDVSVPTKHKFLQYAITRALRRADLLVCVSRETLSSVRARFPSAAAELVYNAVEFSSLPPEFVEPVQPAPYALIVGSVPAWRKRRRLAISVWRGAFPGARLVVVGDALDCSEVNAAGVRLREIDVLQSVPEQRLADLYAGASFALHLAAYEGFGWPVIEANFFNTPVLCSDIPVLQEVGGAGAVYLSEDEIRQIVAGDCRELGEAISVKLQSIRTAGLAAANAQRFSGARQVEQLRAALTRLNI